MDGRSEVKAVIRRFRIVVFMAVCLILLSKSVSGSFGGVTNVGSFTKGASGDTGSREWIELMGSDGLLSGQPKHKAIKLITVYAPGTDVGHLILRELKLTDGRKSLLLSAPDSLSKKTIRVTLYVKNNSKNLSLLEYAEGKWIQRNPVSLRVDTEHNNEVLQDDLLAFSVEGFGKYWLLEGTPPDLSVASTDTHYQSAKVLLGGSISRGLLPLASSFMVLVIGWSISHWIHRRDLNSGK